MKKLLLIVMVLAIITSCGKKNTVTDAVTSLLSAPVLAVINPITIDDAAARQLGTYIDSSTTSFGLGQVSAYENWNQLIVNKPNYSYKYSASSLSSSCEVKTGWLNIKYYVCSSSSTNSSSTISRSVVVSSVDLTTKRNELKAYINSSTPGAVLVSGPLYYIKTTSGVIYSIDIRLPLQANPIGVQQADGKMEHFIGIDL